MNYENSQNIDDKAKKHAECIYKDLRQEEINHLRYRAFHDRLLAAAASGNTEAQERKRIMDLNVENGLMRLSDQQKVLLGVD